MIPYIGDISKQDALVLQGLAREATSILEFGSGASTQVLTAYSDCPVRSVETEPRWIKKTQKRLKDLGLREIVFSSYIEFEADPGKGYDLVFDGGVVDLRREFAILAWSLLKVGGRLRLHDTRSPKPIKDIAVLLERFALSIRSIYVNKDGSNITVFEKGPTVVYRNWNREEGMKPCQIR